jgi:hypothetical protein
MEDATAHRHRQAMTLADALRLACARRPTVYPNLGFLKYLSSLEDQLFSASHQDEEKDGTNTHSVGTGEGAAATAVAATAEGAASSVAQAARLRPRSVPTELLQLHKEALAK